MRVVRVVLVLVACLFSEKVMSQQAGNASFQFMGIPSHAKITGLGGILVSQPGMDVNLAMSNPAQSTDSLNGNFSFSYLDYFADTRKFQAAYQHDIGKAGAWFVAVDHMSYGEFDGFDNTGLSTGDFDAGETLVLVGTSRQVGLFRLGASMKFVSSQIGGFSSSGMALDIGGTFQHPEKSLAVGMVFKNLGVVFNDYGEGSESTMPFDVQAGITFKPKFMPFRFSFTAHHLTDWNLDNFQEDDKPGAMDQLFRHMIVATELLLHKNVELRFGYNHRVRTDLLVEGAGGGSGITYGILFHVKGLSFAYSRGGYSAASGVNNVTLLVDTQRMFGKKIKL